MAKIVFREKSAPFIKAKHKPKSTLYRRMLIGSVLLNLVQVVIILTTYIR